MYKQTLLGLSIAMLISGCMATKKPPQIELITNAESFEVILPLGAESEGTTGWNIDFRPFTNYTIAKGSTIKDFYQITYNEVTSSSELTTNICRGQKFETGSVFKSCINYLADVKTTRSEDDLKVIITPKKEIKQVGGFMMDISLPNVNISDYFGYLSSQEVTVRSKITSKYSSEAIKGNFDRLLKRHKWENGQADAAHRQFKDTYLMTLNNNTDVHISVGFYPYRDGSIVEFVATGISSKNNQTRSINWSTIFNEIEEKLKGVVNS
jgi:hypothetical protein